jgi:DNA repair exonuclease SbcCD ATPase subunit
VTRYFLGRFAIEGFRGINNDDNPLVLTFKPESVNSLHAPNGVGKSSIFEAIHFAIYGSIPRLRALQDAEQGESYVVNKFHPGQQATIEIIRQRRRHGRRQDQGHARRGRHTYSDIAERPSGSSTIYRQPAGRLCPYRL